MKADHEKRFSHLDHVILEKLTDWTGLAELQRSARIRPAAHLERLALVVDALLATDST